MEIFLEVAKDCRFQAAADRLRISQPAVSRQIALLESQLGIKLFERSPGRPGTLTSEGLQYRAKLDAFVETGRALSRRPAMGEPKGRVLRSVVPPHLFDEYFRPSLATFTLRHPQIMFDFKPPRNDAEIAKAVRRGQLDLVCALCNAEPDIPGMEKLLEVPMGLYGRRGFARSGLMAVEGLPLILPPPHSQYESYALHRLEKRGIRATNVVARMEHGDVAVRLACNGVGLCITSDQVIARYDTGDELERIEPLDPLYVGLYLAADLPEDWQHTIRALLIEATSPAPGLEKAR